ncbi:MAG: fibronectin type III domain-containing protein [Deltaproteobacteria bacterium]|nr:fibronectin type III domain-containing protein [Deltaproteobacteria bacterium]
MIFSKVKTYFPVPGQCCRPGRREKNCHFDEAEGEILEVREEKISPFTRNDRSAQFAERTLLLLSSLFFPVKKFFYLRDKRPRLFSRYVILTLMAASIHTACGDVGTTTVKEYALNGTANGTNITLTWTAPSTSQSGSCASDLDGYVIHYGIAPRTYTAQIPVNLIEISCTDTGVGAPSGCGNINNCSYTLSGLSPNEWFFSLKVVDAAGNESSFSNELSIFMP